MEERKPYPGDATDEQWIIIGPMIPHNPCREEHRRNSPGVKYSMASCICCALGVRGANCRTTYRRGTRWMDRPRKACGNGWATGFATRREAKSPKKSAGRSHPRQPDKPRRQKCAKSHTETATEPPSRKGLSECHSGQTDSSRSAQATGFPTQKTRSAPEGRGKFWNNGDLRPIIPSGTSVAPAGTLDDGAGDRWLVAPANPSSLQLLYELPRHRGFTPSLSLHGFQFALMLHLRRNTCEG